MLLSAKRGRSGKGGLLCLERSEWRAASAFLLDATEVLKHQVAGDIKILTESAQHSPISDLHTKDFGALGVETKG